MDISTQFYNALSVSGTLFIDMVMLQENLEINRVDVDNYFTFLWVSSARLKQNVKLRFCQLSKQLDHVNLFVVVQANAAD